MKKFLFLIFFMVSVVFVFSQNTGISSVFNSISEGVFTNELDAAVSVDGMLSSGPDFRSLQHDYLFAGVTNLELDKLIGNFTFSTVKPLWAGFYKAGEKPWSLFGALVATGTTTNSSDGTTYTQGASVNVTTGADTTTYQWNDSSSTMDYTANRIFDALNLSGQYLFTLGGMNSGVYVNVDLINADPQGSNYKKTDVYYYNSTGAGVVPTPLVDYNYSKTLTSRDNTSDFTVAVPLFIPDTDSSQLFNLQTVFSITDKSGSDTESYTGTPQSATAIPLGTTITVADDTTAKVLSGELVFDYTFKKKDMKGTNSKDQFWIKGTADLTLSGVTLGLSNITQPISAAGGGAAIVNGTGRIDTQGTVTGTAGFTGIAKANAGHSFYYDLGSGVEFGVAPEAGLEYKLVLPVIIKSSTQIISTDGDGDGAFTSAADTISTFTQNYTNTSIDTSALTPIQAVMKNAITCSAVLPMAITFTPPKWPITFTLGSKPSITANMTFTNIKTSTTSTVTSTVDGTGTAVGGTTTTNAVTSDETTNMDTTYSVTATHNIGFSMPISDAARIDVSLDLSSSATNVFDFGYLKAQAIIALP